MSEITDLASLYLPAESDTEEVLALRAMIAQRIRDHGIDVDTAPNSPFGDLFVTPAAVGLADRTEAWRRLFSDMDLENVEEGVVYNCDFVRNYLDQLGIHNESEGRSYGLVRLTFTESGSLVLDRSTQFSAGGLTFRPYLTQSGALYILSPGDAVPAGVNWKRLTTRSGTEWVVDILVEGPSGADISAGEGLNVDRTIANLEDATSVASFRSGVPPTTVQDMARRSRYNTHSVTPNTRAGVVSGINHRIPSLTTIGCVVSGDPEMVRDTASNPLRVAAGAMDILVKGDTLVTDTVGVRLEAITTPEGGKVFVGELLLPEVPVEIVSILTESGEDIGLTTVSLTKDWINFPGLSAAYGDNERIYAHGAMPLDDNDNELVALTVEDDETWGVRRFAYFQVTYRFDPDLRMVRDLMSGDASPVGLKTYVRYFNPAVINSLNITYNRSSGVSLLLTQARNEIVKALNSHTFTSPTGAADVVDAMAYAGAHSIESMTLDATVRTTCADQVYVGSYLPDHGLGPLSDFRDEITGYLSYAEFTESLQDAPTEDPGSLVSPDFVLTTDPASGFFAATGKRSVSWLIDSSNLVFTENSVI